MNKNVMSRRIRDKKPLVVASLLCFGVIGIVTVILSKAAGPSANLETELGTIKDNAQVVTDASASGGSAIKFGTQSADEGRFFKMPDLSSSNKLVFAHYFGPYPIHITNVLPSNDYYANNYLRATGESSKFITTGGLLRDRPWLMPLGASTWEYDDTKQDIAWAKDAGINGFYVNLMSLDPANANNRRYLKLRDAATASYPGFSVIPMVDVSAKSSLYTATATDVAALIASFASSSHRLSDGRMLVGSFEHESRTSSWWNSVWSTLSSTYGITAAPVAVYGDLTVAGNYTQYASGRWGSGADPNIYATRSNYGPTAASRGEQYQADVWAQDIRPTSKLFDEARGTKTLMTAWDRAISDGATLVQICTWSDYSEGSHFRPSPARGSVELDLTAWRIAQYKTGTLPTILKDTVYLSHRNQMAASTIAGPQTLLMTQWTRNNRSVFQEKVEVLTFLTAPADVTVTVGGVATTYSAPAGMFSREVDARYGSISATVSRSGQTITSLTSPYQIRQTVWQQDRQYFMSSSLRSTALQFDPTETDTGDKPTYPQL